MSIQSDKAKDCFMDMTKILEKYDQATVLLAVKTFEALLNGLEAQDIQRDMLDKFRRTG